jgi:tetratricopeptide (TPR) repeat protein
VHAAAIAIVCAALYAPVLGAPFVFDDLPNITYNPFIRVSEPSAGALWAAAFESRSPRPLANLTFALNYAACGYEVSCYRAVNVAIHAVNGLLVYALALVLLAKLGRDRTRARDAALLAALVFVAHPVQIESVTYVVQRMTSLATLFYLGALLLYLRGRRGDSSGAGWFAAAALSGVLAFATKQIAATLPLAVLLIEWQFLQGASLAWLRRRVVPIAGMGLALLALGLAYLAAVGFPGYEGRSFTMGERALTQLRVVAFYISLVLWPLPSRLKLTHGFEISTSLVDPITTLLAGLLLLALAATGLALARRERLVSFAILWFFLQLALESSVLPLELVYEHRLYLPIFGLALLAGDSVLRIGRGRALSTFPIAAAIVLLLSVATVERNAVWKDPVALWRDVAIATPSDARAQMNLARALRAAGRLGEAERHLEELVRDRPTDAAAHDTLAHVLVWRSQPERALEHFARAAELAPQKPGPRLNRALVLAQLDREEGLALLRQLVRDEPGYARGHFALGRQLESLGQDAEALVHYRGAVAADPDYNAAHIRLSRLLFVQGRHAEAARHAREALRINPDQAPLRELIERVEKSAVEIEAESRVEPRTLGDVE